MLFVLLIIKNKVVVKHFVRVVKRGFCPTRGRYFAGHFAPVHHLYTKFMLIHNFLCAVIITEEIYKGICMRLLMSKNIYM